MRTKHILGNWKMHQTTKEIMSFCESISIAWMNMPKNAQCGIAPQALHLSMLKEKLPRDFMIGTQNCASAESGAFTGELSPVAIRDLGLSFTLIGHSERRAIFGEKNQTLNEKVKVALKNELRVVFCIGETLEEREGNKTETVLKSQLEEGLKDIKPTSKLLIAYEPVWAIGTGKTATPEMAEETHAFVRKVMGELGHDASKTVILYGGSVKPDNISGLMAKPNIDGALVGGASLKADDFLALCYAANNA